MKNSKGSAALVVLCVMFVGILMLAVSALVFYWQYHDYGAMQDNLLKTKYENQQTIMSNGTAKIQELAAVPEMYKNDLKEIVEATFQGRYGEDGSKAVFQFIQENNLNLDPTTYQLISQEIKVFRADFQAEQTSFLDVRNAYQNQIDRLWSGFWLRLTGYPKTALDTYKIIVLKSTTEQYETGVMETIKLR